MMNSENNGPLDREELLEQLFDRALQQPSAERKNWVVSACDGDGELTQELIDLVCAHDAAPDCLDAPPWSPGGMLVADSDELSLGSTIGPYVVGRLLGEGGMGSVYLAEQCEPLRRQVALKVIKLGMDTREVLARFDAERQLLARLSHPHVAAVHDAGATPRGRPYFVMEWVDGEPITSFCDRLRLNVDDRLALFEKVCDAVQHAHQQGVMHRDLKPGNILVSESAGHAVPKVIDFGVAKAVGSDSRLETSCTRIGQQIGTPGYMSPEQASPDQVVDTRTDVYSLGALLHELLVGALPRDAKKLGQLNPEGLARELVDTEVV
ncbi:MAG: serine/threonine protein kinase, partial [Pseudohongiellaceae bacterium]